MEYLDYAIEFGGRLLMLSGMAAWFVCLAFLVGLLFCVAIGPGPVVDRAKR